MYLTKKNHEGNELITDSITTKYSIGNDPFSFALPSQLPITLIPGPAILTQVPYEPTDILFLTQSKDLVIISKDPDESTTELIFGVVGFYQRNLQQPLRTSNFS